MSRTAPLNEANRACESIGQSSLAINGQEQMVKKIDFTTNSIHSKFTDNPPVTQAASGLPQMQGARLCKAPARIGKVKRECCYEGHIDLRRVHVGEWLKGLKGGKSQKKMNLGRARVD